MNWLTVAWSICAGICVMLALLHILLWMKDRSKMAYLLSAVMALSAAASAIAELSLLHTQSVSAYLLIMRWQVFFVYLLLMPLLWLVSLRLDSSHRWLANLIVAIWTVALVINFVSPGNLVYENLDEITRYTTIWGEHYSHGVGPENPWNILANVAVLLILIYVIMASNKSWRRGEHKRTIVIGGSIVAFLLLGGIHSMLVDSGMLATPYMVSFAYLAIVLAMSYELVSDAVQVPMLSREIHANEKRWQDLLENVQLAVIAIDAKGCISYANPFFEKLSGYSANNLQDKQLITLLPEDEREEFRMRIEQAMKIGPRPHSQWTVICATGEERQLAWSAVRQNDSNGEFAGIIAVGADITERLTTQRELQQSQRELERLTRASMLGELASALAHELNQPLTAILSNSQAALRFMANDQVGFGELHDILEDIVRDDKRAGEVIHSMRAMLRKGEIKREQFDIKKAIDEVVTMLHNELDAQSIRVEIELPTDLPLISAGRVEIQQVLMNIILNAARAMQSTPTEQRAISIQACKDEANITLLITDRGSGIDPSDLPNIFTAFYSTKSANMGMGLAICKRIIEAHGGKICAENNPLGGAVFTFTLPVKR